MREQFITKKFQQKSLDLIDTCNEIIDDYEDQGLILSLRQLYYKLVTRNAIPNTEKSYSRIGSLLRDARLAGLVDWDMIEDRTRGLESLPHWLRPADIVGACAEQFRIDKWADQEWAPMVWIEKEALWSES